MTPEKAAEVGVALGKSAEIVNRNIDKLAGEEFRVVVIALARQGVLMGTSGLDETGLKLALKAARVAADLAPLEDQE